jgi:hypothetical protein
MGKLPLVSRFAMPLCPESDVVLFHQPVQQPMSTQQAVHQDGPSKLQSFANISSDGFLVSHTSVLFVFKPAVLCLQPRYRPHCLHPTLAMSPNFVTELRYRPLCAPLPRVPDRQIYIPISPTHQPDPPFSSAQTLLELTDPLLPLRQADRTCRPTQSL